MKDMIYTAIAFIAMLGFFWVVSLLISVADILAPFIWVGLGAALVASFLAVLNAR